MINGAFKTHQEDELLQECLGQVKIDIDEKREPTYTIKLLLRRCHQHVEEAQISRHATSS